MSKVIAEEFLDGWSIRYGYMDSICEVAYLKRADGWTREKAERVADICNRFRGVTR